MHGGFFVRVGGSEEPSSLWIDTDSPQAATISMSNLRETLRDLIRGLPYRNNDETLAQYRFWLDLGTAHGHISRGQVENDARQLIVPPDQIRDDWTWLIHPTAHLFFRFMFHWGHGR